MPRKQASAELTAALLKAAKKCSVRECDETSPGQFVAYVDEGVDTWDVSVTFNAEGNPEATTCECGEPLPCLHLAALLLHLAEGKVAATHAVLPKKAKAKKIPPYVALLDELDTAALKRWLHDTLPDNKELQLAFVHHFSGRRKAYTPAEAAQLTTDAVKTVLGKTRKPDATAIRKIVALWKDLHAPILERYRNGLADGSAFLPLQAAMDACIDFLDRYGGGSKVQAYLDGQIAALQPGLLALALDEAFERATGLFMTNLIDKDGLRVHYLPLLHKLSADTTPERRLLLARAAGAHRKAWPGGNHSRHYAVYLWTMMQLLVGGGLFKEHAALFAAVPHASDYNLALIRELVVIGEWNRAVSICWEQIRLNSRADYDVPYLRNLRELYRADNHTMGLIRVAEYSLQLTWEYEDYKVIVAPMDEAGRAAFRKELYTKTRHNKHRPGAAELSMHLLAEQGMGGKMIELVGHGTTPYSSILAHLDIMLAANPKALLKELFARQIDSWHDEDDTGPALPELTDRLITAYGAPAIKMALATFRTSSYGTAAVVKWLRKVVD